MEENIIFENAINALQQTLKEDVCIQNTDHLLKNAIVIIKGVKFLIEIRSELTLANYLTVVQFLNTRKQETGYDVLLICKRCTSTVLEKCYQDGINVLDFAGNCLISANGIYVNIQGKKANMPIPTNDKTFNEAGIKLVYFFLYDKENISKSYREIAQDTGLSLGTITNVINELMANKFVSTSGKKRIIINREVLIEQWQQTYNRVLKPKLFIGKMKFMSKEAARNWREIALPDNSVWGGESGANIIDGYLQPEIFSIYTDKTMSALLATRNMAPAPDGQIYVYKKFWPIKDNATTTARLIIYADLMGSGNSRCLEAAQRIKQNGL